MTESRQTRAPVGLTTPLQYVKGVGPHRARQLEKKGLVTVGDALFHLQEWETVDAADDEPIHAGALVPVYSTTEGLPQQALRSLLWRLVEAHAHEVDETLPDAVRARRRLVPLADAVRGAHFPATEAERAAAVRRLAFDDFLLLQLGFAI